MTTATLTPLSNYKLTADDVTLDSVHIKFKGASWITGSVKGGYIDNFTLANSVVSGFEDKPGDWPWNENWGARVFNMRDGLVTDSIFRNIEKEHGWYMSRAGNFRFLRCLFQDIGSQGIQDAQREMDLIGGRADNVACLLEILQCKFERCATTWGRRQSWNVSIFAFDENLREWYPDGPLILTAQGNPQKGHLVRSLTDVVIAGCDFSGNGYPHIASGNRDCDSTGAILVQDRWNLVVRRCSFNFERPDRETIQIRNVEDAIVSDCTFAPGNDIVLHNMDNCHVTIQNCTGDGWIRRRVLGSHTTTKLAPISACTLAVYAGHVAIARQKAHSSLLGFGLRWSRCHFSIGTSGCP